MPFRMIDLFSGIGGFSLAASWVWGEELEIVSFVERDKFCQQVLKKHWPEVPIHDDIKTFSYHGAVDLITGGFPCQPFSCAGKRGGKNDDRYLWPEMLRVISEAKPRWVIGENVAGIISMAQQYSDSGVEGETDNSEEGEIFGTADGTLHGIISDIEGIGYDVQTFCIPACSVNAPHRRDRVWICGNAPHPLNQGLLGGSAEGVPEQQWLEQGQQIWENTRGEYARCDEKSVDAADPQGLPIRPGLCPDEPGGIWRRRLGDDGGQDAADTGNQRLQGCQRPRTHGKGREETYVSTSQRLGPWHEDWYSVALRTCVRGVDDGLPNRVDRLKALGNSVVPQVVYQIMNCIKEINGLDNRMG